MLLLRYPYIQSNATENTFSRQTDTRHSEVIGKAAADDQRNNSIFQI